MEETQLMQDYRELERARDKAATALERYPSRIAKDRFNEAVENLRAFYRRED